MNLSEATVDELREIAESGDDEDAVFAGVLLDIATGGNNGR